MSVLYTIILGMDNWNKYTYVCATCDGLFEMTVKSNNEINDDNCPVCEIRSLNLLSVVDATINPIEQKEEQTMETLQINYDPNALVTYKKIDGEEVSYPTQKVTEIEYALEQSRRNYNTLVEKQNSWYKKESQLRTLLEEVYADSGDQESLMAIAEIFDVPLTKEIEVTAWIRVDMTIEVDLAEGDYDIEDMVRNNLTIDSYGSEISVNDYDVDRVEEGAY